MTLTEVALRPMVADDAPAFARCMQREYGCTPMEYLLRFRIEQSKLLLMQTDWTVARIAEEVGFNQAPYFSSCFSRLEGMSPRQYRQLFH